MQIKDRRKLWDIFYRYSVLLIFSIFSLTIFYFIFRPLTIFPTYFLFEIFYNVDLIDNFILYFGVNLPSLEIIGACIAGSAYLLLLILNFSTSGIKLKKRLLLLVLAFLIFLIINILRIFFVGMLFLNGTVWADFAHKFFWYFGSIFVVVLIWFAEVKLFDIKEIPFYSDFKFVKKILRK
jgi:exosortase/archaeosortase family protein